MAMISIPAAQNAGLKANFDMESLANHIQKKNVVYGTNYIIPNVSNFVLSSHHSDLRRRVESTGGNFSIDTALVETHLVKIDNTRSSCQTENTSTKDSGAAATTSQSHNSALKRSLREKKRSIALEKNQVRYLVSEVPQVSRNKEFIRRWRVQDKKSANGTIKDTAPRRTLPSRLCNAGLASEFHAAPHLDNLKNIDELVPFVDGSSVLWIPTERYHWEDSLSEMTAVCTSAALRRHVATLGRSATKPFFAPLSRDYIRDRVDIDDPLYGFQIRHATSGWLQGFVMFTTFTTWSHFFKWDSMHPSSGLQPREGETSISDKCDFDGSMSLELEEEPRSGDPLAGGVVFPTIAEISLLGGLGCGEYLLRMALDDIIAKEHYKYVVLQATNSSIPFYERFGFIRVGAVSRYGGDKITNRVIRNPEAVKLSDIIGYHHWTYAHESERSLGKHGGPSYMMARRLPQRDDTNTDTTYPSFFDIMKKYAVERKPRISAAGGIPTGKRNSADPFSAPFPLLSRTPIEQNGLNGKKASQKNSQFHSFSSPMTKLPVLRQSSKGKDQRGSATVPAAEETTPSQPTHKGQQSHSKRLRTNAPLVLPTNELFAQRGDLLAPPREGQALSYNQKQYQSPWLAVPPTATAPLSRPPPKLRSPVDIASSGIKRKHDGITSSPSKALGIDEKLANRPLSSMDKSVSKTSSSGVETGKKCQTSDFEQQAEISSCIKPNRKETTTKNKESRFFSFRKQRIMNMPKHVPREQQFFNKVVRVKGSEEKKYWFVLHYDHEQGFMRVIPLGVHGVLTGKREGRLRWKALVEFSDINVQTVQPAKYEIVQAFMVTKTPMVELETWDIVD